VNALSEVNSGQMRSQQSVGEVEVQS